MIAGVTINRSNLTEETYAVLRTILLDGKSFQPGEKINVEGISREFGVSRSPVWAAIARLEVEGIVDVLPRQGVFLVSFDKRRIREVFAAREALEGMAAREAAAKVDQAGLARLEELIRDQRACIRRGDVEGYGKLALEFHETVVRLAQNESIERFLRSLYGQIQAMCGCLRADPSRLRENCEDHQRLLKGLRRRDGNAAEREARAHVRKLCKALAALPNPAADGFRRPRRVKPGDGQLATLTAERRAERDGANRSQSRTHAISLRSRRR